MRRSPHYRAFISLDVFLAVALLTLLTTVLLASVAYARRASVELAAYRAALNHAENALSAMQDSASPAATMQDVTVTDLAASAPRGLKWVQVRAQRQGKSAVLVGLVPQGGVQ